ncbi:hypothetical protein BGX34_005285 [Mortierella sp. NVP85]|nr:hypothetical protein BGX34_005285 [Mortierella sp. NVP85]
MKSYLASSHNGGSRSRKTSTSSGSSASPLPALPSIAQPTPKPILPPLNFMNTQDGNSFGQSVGKVGTSSVGDTPSRAAENVTVTVRVRPFSATELRAGGGPREVWQVQEDTQISYADDYLLRERRAAVDYAFDHALTGSDNEAIYSKSVKDLVQSAMEGYNSTVFAYGQTSSGKTYSGTEMEPGIIPRTVEDVFKYIHENSEREFLLRVSYLEIYNESIRDLLSPEAIDLRIHEDRRRGVYVSPLKEEIVTTPSQVMRIIQRGDYQRHTSTTDYNTHSSRSHSIFQIVIESRERAPTAPQSPVSAGSPISLSGRRMSFGLKSPSAVRVSQLNLIDLAGSEKAATDAERRKEGSYINKSLLTLGTVISRLTDDKGSHIPFRDSKLTRILQSSLSGNARVSVICTISPSLLNVEESHNTLKFAARVKKIVTRAQTNQVMDDKALLEKYRREISELKAQLLLTAAEVAAGPASAGPASAGVRASIGAGGIDKQKHAELSHLLEKERLKHEEEMMEMNMVRNALRKRIEHLTKLILTSQSVNSRTGYANSDDKNANGGAQDGSSGNGGSQPLSLPARYTVETTADGSVMEFPREIESRLARKDTIVRQLQSELELQQEKMALMKNALQKTVRGEMVDIERTLAKVETGYEPREKMLIEKRASILGLNGIFANGNSNSTSGNSNRNSSIGKGSRGRGSMLKWQSGAMLVGDGIDLDKELVTSPIEQNANGVNKSLDSLLQQQQQQQQQQGAQVGKVETIEEEGQSAAFPEGEHLAIDDEEEDEDLMDTPWNREELVSLRQAKRELEIVVIEQEKKLEEMVSFEDSEEFRNLVLELEDQREKIVAMEEEREGFKSTITELKNTIRKLEMSRSELGGGGRGAASTPTPTTAGTNRAQELELMLQRERKLRMEEQTNSMSRIASLEAQLSILMAEQSVRELA